MEAMLSEATLSRILDSTGPYADEAERETCEKMVEELTEEEQELAACTSYAYWLASTTRQSCSQQEDVRKRMAMREARRHFVGEGHDYEKGLTALRQSCAYRKERKPDLFRTLFDASYSYQNPEDSKMAEMYRSLVENDLQKQLMVVRGMDKLEQAIVIKFARHSSSSDEEEAFVTTQLYIAERAIATTEILSGGRHEKVTVVFDFGSYERKNAPPWSAIMMVAHLLQRNYPERLDHLMVLDAPLFMRALFRLIHPFLRAATKEKLIMIADDETKRKLIGSRISTENAMPFMLPEGKLASDVDLEHFLHNVPFHGLYDETTTN